MLPSGIALTANRGSIKLHVTIAKSLSTGATLFATDDLSNWEVRLAAAQSLGILGRPERAHLSDDMMAENCLGDLQNLIAADQSRRHHLCSAKEKSPCGCA